MLEAVDATDTAEELRWYRLSLKNMGDPGDTEPGDIDGTDRVGEQGGRDSGGQDDEAMSNQAGPSDDDDVDEMLLLLLFDRGGDMGTTRGCSGMVDANTLLLSASLRSVVDGTAAAASASTSRRTSGELRMLSRSMVDCRRGALLLVLLLAQPPIVWASLNISSKRSLITDEARRLRRWGVASPVRFTPPPPLLLLMDGCESPANVLSLNLGWSQLSPVERAQEAAEQSSLYDEPKSGRART
jgi:hypothetical protein